MMKLHYFDTAGRAEALRLACAVGELEFEDFRFAHDQWPALKSNYVTGTVPAISFDNGETYNESLALLIFICHKCGMFPADSLALLASMQCASYVATEIFGTMQGFKGLDGLSAEDKQQRLSAVNAELQQKLSVLENMCKQRSKHVSDKLDFADFVAHQITNIVESKMFNIDCSLVECPCLCAMSQKVKTHPKVVAYYTEKQSQKTVASEDASAKSTISA